MVKKISTFLIILVLLIGTAIDVEAVPEVSVTWVYTEHYGPTDAPGFIPEGRYVLHIGAFVFDTVDIVSVMATDGFVYELIPLPMPIFPLQYNTSFIPYSGQTGIWEITATNVNGESANNITHELDTIHKLDYVTGIEISNSSTTPTICWDRIFFDDDYDLNTPEVEVDAYRVRLLTSAANQFYRSPRLRENCLTIPIGQLNPGNKVYIRVLAIDYEDQDGIEDEFGIVQENRSSAFVAFTPTYSSIAIDIKPGSFPNSINCNNENGVVPVAVLSTEHFDATTVDHTTVFFEGAYESHIVSSSGEPRRHEEDVDDDGDIDLVFHFNLVDTNLTCDSSEGTLIGETFGGEPIGGSDSLNMIGGE